MGIRFHSLKRAASAAATLIGASCLVAALRNAPSAGFQQPSRTTGAQGPATVTWVFDLDELISCDPPTSVLRQLQQRLRGRISVSALYVGSDPARARSFLATERLPVPVNVISEAEYRARYHAHRRPIIVYSDGVAERVLGKQSWAVRENSQPTEMETVITQMVSHYALAK
jgi:hypothetical protein